MLERRTSHEYRRMTLYLRSLERLGIKLGLENISRLLEAIDAPHRKFPAILIGGTNGKGSVAAMLASILEQAGLHTGLYTSPHLIRLEERIVTGGRPIPPDQLAAKILSLRETIHALFHSGALKTSPTFFEVTTAAALSYFHDDGVQIAILEVGMGGRFDATNAVLVVKRRTMFTTPMMAPTMVTWVSGSSPKSRPKAPLRAAMTATRFTHNVFEA